MVTAFKRACSKTRNYTLIDDWDWWLKKLTQDHRFRNSWTEKNNQNASDWECNFMKEIRLRGANGALDSCYKRDLKHGCRVALRENFKVSSSLLNWENLKWRFWTCTEVC